MKKFLFIAAFLLNSSLFALEIPQVYPDGWYVDQIVPGQDWLVVKLSNKNEKTGKYYKLNIKNFEVVTINEEEFKKLIQQLPKSKDKISYTLSDCSSIDEEYLSYESRCYSATFNVNDKAYNLSKEKFYKWERFYDPKLWSEYLFFRIYYPRSKSGDTDKWGGPSYNGGLVIDLKNLKRETVLRGAFLTYSTLDNHNSFLWVGSQYGIYAFNKNMQESISCAFPNDMKKMNVKEFSLVCGKADYLDDNKYNQARMLLNKHKALKDGKKPPEDVAKKMREGMEKVHPKK